MKTLALLSQKGGSGKSTLAVHLATFAQQKYRHTTIIDLDPQASVAGWGRKRRAARPEVLAAKPADLPRALYQLRNEGAELCVIDTRPSAGADAIAAAAQADLVLIPTRAAVFDLEAIGATVDLVTSLQKPVWVVLNAVPPSRAGEEAALTREARVALTRDYKARVTLAAIGNRNAFHTALLSGGAVHEIEPHGKAAAEVKALWRFLERQLWRRGSSSSSI